MGSSAPKLGFTISSCSGEDADYPVSELLCKDPQVKGWQTPRFCKWPQQVTLQLEGLANVHQIQILSHEYKIASKVELHIGTPGGGEAVSWKRLGSFSFDCNERSKLQARELKSVTVSVQALFVRIVLARCHSNAQNAYSQAGILGVSIAGELLRRSSTQLRAQLPGSPLPAAAAETAGRPQPTPPSAQSRSGDGSSARASEDTAGETSPGAAGGGDAGADVKTAARLRDLEGAKACAVAEEDYDEAKRLKLAIDRLKAVATQLSDLEARKRAAVEAEDYDVAKALKQDIERLRLAGGASPSGRAPNGQEEPAYNGGLGSRKEHSNGMALSPSSYSNHDEIPISPIGALPFSQPPCRRSTQDEGPGYAASSRRASSTPSQAYDERPAVARGSYSAATAEVAAPALAPAARALDMDRALVSSSAPDSAGPPPPGWPGDLAPPEPLSAADAKDTSELLSVLEEYLVRCLFSKNWQLREAALQHLEKRLSGQDLAPDAKRELARSLAHSLRIALTDKVPGVYMAGLSLLRAVTNPGVMAPRECASLVADLAPLLIDKAGENNARVQAAAVETLLALAQQKEAGLSALVSLFLKPEKATQWKRVLGRLQLLEVLIPVFGVGKGDSFSLEPLMKFLGATLGNANADVRAAATRITEAIHEAELRHREAVLGPTHPDLADSLSNLAILYNQQGDFGRAQPLYERALRIYEAVYGSSSTEVADTLTDLAVLHLEQGNDAAGRPLLQKALIIQEAALGPDHPDVQAIRDVLEGED
ncbi:hypothetical protein COCSUDRAFT_30401 [Coccomyxa subellipsoidea C-169]|uniref:TOG domain-containing protein n=1 Tax=Coccomyxa subellipsoidea (strain C-169) TaxID=574566 RepID=I0YQI5_COCSC|nr:hypothetical protein COCSUDRAFT_30401 [Coccomyxa subellipsoidea C-169]EIE20654.1 hypothetical protein COCSUDRAFT_30401 [Coccomyxa subellipsoidea C-169]|eukprot:XP_005645198.1 hypothetical protein COCSUDRAFT_30401 [Coccomyxa subellipsoidea C-169]